MDRRRFMEQTGLAFGASLLALPGARAALRTLERPPTARLQEWEAVRRQFALDPEVIQMSGFYLAPHPAPVREAIARHRDGLDANPLGYHHEHAMEAELAVLDAAGRYLGVEPDGIALTDSTTMGLGLVYTSIGLRPGQEILTTPHDHYSTWRSLELRAERTGATVERVTLYDPAASASVEDIVDRLASALTPRTRLVAVTWVHSSTGVRLPIREMAEAIARANRGRAEEDRILLSVDGVHGLGVEDVALPQLKCDIFIAGTHKWMFGPRGTGLVYATPAAREVLPATIPPFPPLVFGDLPIQEVMERVTWGMAVSPGGFHSFEHRWAVTEAFEFHERIGKDRVAARIHALNRRLKEALAEMRRVTLHTPLADELSAGMVCFEVDGMTPREVVTRLAGERIAASVTPYEVEYARLAPGLLNDEDEVERTIQALAALRA